MRKNEIIVQRGEIPAVVSAIIKHPAFRAVSNGEVSTSVVFDEFASSIEDILFMKEGMLERGARS